MLRAFRPEASRVHCHFFFVARAAPPAHAFGRRYRMPSYRRGAWLEVIILMSSRRELRQVVNPQLLFNGRDFLHVHLEAVAAKRLLLNALEFVA